MNVTELFENELARRAVAFAKTAERRYAIRVGGRSLDVTLDNLVLEIARDGKPAMVTAFVDRLLAVDRPAPWSTSQRHVYWSAEPTTQTLGDAIYEDVTATVRRVLVVTDAVERVFTFVTPAQIRRWKQTPAKVRAAADRNQSRLLEGIALEVSEIDGMKLGMVPLASALKASVIFAEAFGRFVAPVGWPVYVVIPCRDFIYVVGDQALLGRLGAVVQREYRASGYPITTEVLRVDDAGITAIGRFPE